MIELAKTVVYSGLLFYVAYTINARYVEYVRSKEPLADSQLKDVLARLEAHEQKINSLSIQNGMKEM